MTTRSPGIRKFALASAIAVVGAILTLPGSSSADVVSVSGSACGYYTDVSLFGGPSARRGCGQTVVDPFGNSPSVTLPSSGSVSPITANDPDGATATYGPAKIFSGQ